MYRSSRLWEDDRPKSLVIACSDGRFQEHIDEFLANELGIIDYDRLYVPGGPGALASSGFEYPRADQFRSEYRFLLKAHDFRQVVLIFHSNAEHGPHAAMCADYLRKLPGKTNAQLRAQQEADVIDLFHAVFGWPPEMKIMAYRAEVLEDNRVQFVSISKR